MVQDLDFPGGKIPLTSQMKFISEASDKRLPCYRVLNEDGSLISNTINDQVYVTFQNCTNKMATYIPN